MNCPKCGAPVQGESNYCTSCGAEVSAPTPVPFVSSEGAVASDSGKFTQNKPLIIVLLAVLAAVVILAVSFFTSRGNVQAAYGDEIDVATDTRFIPRDDDGNSLDEYEVTVEPADNRTPTVTYIPLRVHSDEGFTVQDVVNIQEENSMTYGSYRMTIVDSGNQVRQTVVINVVDPDASGGSASGGGGGANSGGGKSGSGTLPSTVDLNPKKDGSDTSSSGGTRTAPDSYESGGLTGQSEDIRTADAAYLEVVQRLVEKHGEPAAKGSNGGTVSTEGVCLVELVDFDGDGVDELVVGYYDKSREDPARALSDFPDALAYVIEVWGCKDGKAEKLHEQAAEYSNGGFAFLVLCERTDDVVLQYGAYGEMGAGSHTYAYYGFDDGIFQELTNGTATGPSGNEYYIDGAKVGKGEYDSRATTFLGTHHTVCYQLMTASTSSAPVDDWTSYTAAQVAERAKSTIDALRNGASAGEERADGASKSSKEASRSAAKDAFASFPMDFQFTSGAGGWSTDLTVRPDGTFQGTFHDSDLGDTGEGYPGGTMYLCNFEGKFTEPRKTGDCEYKMQIEYLRVLEEPGESIEDGRLIVRVDEPYGLGEPTEQVTGDVRLYVPGRSMGDLSREFLVWTFQNKNTSGTLGIYALDVFVDGDEYGWMGAKA